MTGRAETPPGGSPVPAPDHRKVVIAAATCAAVVLASQLAGKAARDAIFLQQFEVTNLPLLLAVSSAMAIGTTFIVARHLSRGIPTRVIQIANLASAVLLVVEYLMLDYLPGPTATVVYMHQTLIGPILVSGFWSIVSECFDPRTARKVIGSIGTGATVGGLLGALLAERVAAMIGTQELLLAIAGLQLIAMWRIGVLGGHGTAAAKPVETTEGEPPAELSLKDVLVKITTVSLLRKLAIITIVVTVAAALLDYVFKAHVTTQVHADDLTRVFALFHGIVGLLTAVVAWSVGKFALQKWGLARTLAALPGSVIVFGALALAAPGIGTYIILRGAENVVRNSLYREAYEVFYTPLLVSERRATKTIIDVGVERFGDVLGGLVVLFILAFATQSTTVLLVGAIGLSTIGVLVALAAQRSYVEALERSLVARSIELDDDGHDRTTRTTLESVARRTGSMPAMSVKDLAAAAGPATSGRWPFRSGRRVPHERGALDPSLKRLHELMSGDPARIRVALSSALLSPATVAYAIPLLARLDVGEDVQRAIGAVAGACVGQLIDAARDPQLPVGVRAKLPALITSAGGERSRAGLLACLSDPEFKVRFQAAQALLEQRERDPQIMIDHEAVFDGVRRELSVEPAIWKALDVVAAEVAHGIEGPQVSDVARHLATLLALALPSEPVKTAIHGLWSDDAALRGVSLEYLENVLPPDIRERMWILLAIDTPAAAEAAAKRAVEDVRADLVHSLAASTGKLAIVTAAEAGTTGTHDAVPPAAPRTDDPASSS